MKTFYIEQLQIRNFGRIENEYIAFSPGLNTIEHEHGDEIKVAVRLLVDAFRFSGDVCDFVTPDTKISGKIILGSKKYGISRAPIKKNSKKLDKKIFLAEDFEFSKEKQSKEEFELSSFDDSGNDYSSKLMNILQCLHLLSEENTIDYIRNLQISLAKLNFLGARRENTLMTLVQ